MRYVQTFSLRSIWVDELLKLPENILPSKKAYFQRLEKIDNKYLKRCRFLSQGLKESRKISHLLSCVDKHIYRNMSLKNANSLLGFYYLFNKAGGTFDQYSKYTKAFTDRYLEDLTVHGVILLLSTILEDKEYVSATIKKYINLKLFELETMKLIKLMVFLSQNDNDKFIVESYFNYISINHTKLTRKDIAQISFLMPQTPLGSFAKKMNLIWYSVISDTDKSLPTFISNMKAINNDNFYNMAVVLYGMFHYETLSLNELYSLFSSLDQNASNYGVFSEYFASILSENYIAIKLKNEVSSQFTFENILFGIESRVKLPLEIKDITHFFPKLRKKNGYKRKEDISESYQDNTPYNAHYKIVFDNFDLSSYRDYLKVNDQKCRYSQCMKKIVKVNGSTLNLEFISIYRQTSHGYTIKSIKVEYYFPIFNNIFFGEKHSKE